MNERQLRTLTWQLFVAMKEVGQDAVGGIKNDGTCSINGCINLQKVTEEFLRRQKIQESIDLCNSMLFVDPDEQAAA